MQKSPSGPQNALKRSWKHGTKSPSFFHPSLRSVGAVVHSPLFFSSLNTGNNIEFINVTFTAVPEAVTKAVPIKLNAAAIRREEQLFRKQKEEEEKRLAGIEAGSLFDEVAFEQWLAVADEKNKQVWASLDQSDTISVAKNRNH